jgi:hypothetical protein
MNNQINAPNQPTDALTNRLERLTDVQITTGSDWSKEIEALARAVIQLREHNKCSCGLCSLCKIDAALSKGLGL